MLSSFEFLQFSLDLSLFEVFQHIVYTYNIPGLSMRFQGAYILLGGKCVNWKFTTIVISTGMEKSQEAMGAEPLHQVGLLI